jgi:hypothetical protein
MNRYDDLSSGANLLEICKQVLDLAGKTLANVDLGRLRADVDQYWTISPQDAFGLVSQPEVLVGSLQDDFEELHGAVQHVESDRIVWHELQHVASVVAFLAYATSPPMPSEEP